MNLACRDQKLKTMLSQINSMCSLPVLTRPKLISLIPSFRLLPPPAMWAQRKNLVSLTINVEDCKEPVITLEPTKVYFKGTGGPDKKTFEVTIDLFGEIDTAVSLIVCSCLLCH